MLHWCCSNERNRRARVDADVVISVAVTEETPPPKIVLRDWLYLWDMRPEQLSLYFF